MICPKCLATIDKYKVRRTKSKLKATCHNCKAKLVQEYPTAVGYTVKNGTFYKVKEKEVKI